MNPPLFLPSERPAEEPAETPGLAAPDTAVLAGLVDAVPLYLAAFTVDRRYLCVNTRYAARFGLTPADLVGRYLGDVIGGAAIAVIEPFIAQVLTGQTVTFERAIDYGRVPTQTLRTTLTPMRDAAGAVTGWYGAAEDVTDARRVETSLQDDRSQLLQDVQ